MWLEGRLLLLQVALQLCCRRDQLHLLVLLIFVGLLVMSSVVLATLQGLAREGEMDAKVVAGALADLGIDPDKPNPYRD